MCLTHGLHHELTRHPNFVYFHSDAAVTPIIKDVLSRYPHIKPNLRTVFHGFCFDEGAPQSVTGVNQWVAYLSTYHLPSSYHDIHQLHSKITFRGSGTQKVEVSTIGRVTIRIPLPGQTYFDYQSLLIQNDVPMFFGLASQTRLHTVTEKPPLHPVAHLNTLSTTIPLTLKIQTFILRSTSLTGLPLFLVWISADPPKSRTRSAWINLQCVTPSLSYREWPERPL